MQKERDLFMGRMQPPHNGHLKVIKGMSSPIIALVKGEKSSADKEKNPLSAEQQMTLIKKIVPQADVDIVKTGYLPDVIKAVEEKFNCKIKRIFAGGDRAAKYQSMIAKSNPDVSVVTIDRGDDNISATKVREAIRTGDEASFKKLVPQAIWGDFKNLKTLLEAFEYQERLLEMKTFEDFIAENEDCNKADGIATKEKPMIDKPAKRKPVEKKDESTE